MEGQSSEGSTKPKTRTKAACDVGCQTDAAPTPRLYSSQHGSWLNGHFATVMSPPSAQAAGSSASQKHQNGQSSGTSNAQTQSDNKQSAPAGVVPSAVAEYFADKQTAAPGSTTNPKVRTSSTTGVVGEGKKCVRAQAVIQQQQGASSSNNSNGTAKADPPCWEDESTTLRLIIDHFSSLDETVCSEAKSIKGVSWKIMVMPKQHMVQKKQQKCMGFFLQCAPQRAYSDQWSVHAVADMRMLSNKPDGQHFARRTTHTYTSKENDWGYSCFMTWADILEDSQGYIKDDCIILEIAVQSEAPKNMISHEDFVKKIDNWISLADFQMKKGCIDLAIEANANAKAFCQGKDEECMERLKKQAELFDEAKIQETIVRLEKKGQNDTKPADVPHGKPTSLRQALTGAQKSLNGKITAKGGKKTRAVVTVQHMKKKKPYEQNNTNQQRVANNTGNSTVKDLVEIKKNSKAESPKNDSKQADEEGKHARTMVGYYKPGKNEEEELKTENTEGYEVEPDGAVFSVSEEDDDDDYDEDEEVYNEGDYADQALNVNGMTYNQCDPFSIEPELMAPEDLELANGDHAVNLQWSSSCEDLINANKKSWAEDNLGYNHDGIMMCDRMTQVEHSDVRDVDSARDDLMANSNDFYRMMFAKSATESFINSSNTEFQDVPQFYSKFMEVLESHAAFQKSFVDSPGEISKLLNFDSLEATAAMAAHLGMKVDEMPMMPYTREEDSSASSQDTPFFSSECDKLIRQWLNVEGALTTNVQPNSVLARMDEADRRQLISELTTKLNPLIVALDVEFRDSTFEAQQFLEHSRSIYGLAQAVAKDFEKIKENFEEKIIPAFGKDVVKKEQKKGAAAQSKEKTVTSAAATSGSKANNKGRPTVIAKRSLKNASADPSATPSNEADISLESLTVPIANADSMRDVMLSFKNLNHFMGQLDNALQMNNVRMKNVIADVFGDDGFAKRFKDLHLENEHQRVNALQEMSKLMQGVAKATDEKNTALTRLSESNHALQAEVEKNTKAQKEVKDLRSQLKKAENRATKEENRATAVQVSLNDIDEKYKSLRKETETLRKKTTEERAKNKKDKERDSQTIRQQAIELSERENEVDKLKKEVEESHRTRDKIDKDRRMTTAQLTSVTDRARNAEALVIEVRKSVAIDLLKQRKAEALAGYVETEKNMNSSRHANDREVMRKSLAEWKSAVDKCDVHIKSVASDHDNAMESIKSGSKTLVQIGEIKLPAQDALPKLVKPPPIQVVAPSSAVIIPPVVVPTPAAGVIGQQRTPIASRTQHSSTDSQNVSACSTPSRSRVSRLPSPVNTPSKTSTSTRITSEDAPTSTLWSWNTIVGKGSALSAFNGSDSSFNTSLDALHRDVLAANGNAIGGLGNDFTRNSLPASSSAVSSSQFSRQPSHMTSQSSISQQSMQMSNNSQNLSRTVRGGYDGWTPTQIFQQPIPQQSVQQQQHQQQQQSHQQQQQQRNEALQQQYGYANLGLNTHNSSAPTWRTPQSISSQLQHQNSSSNPSTLNPYHPFFDQN